MRFDAYRPGQFYDEMFVDAGRVRPQAVTLCSRLEALDEQELERQQLAAELALMQTGITFGVGRTNSDAERIFPFDIVPRIIAAEEWQRIERGLRQRVTALNLFVDDVYHDRRIFRDGIIPAEVVLSSSGYREACVGLKPRGGIWCHIAGIDLVRDRDGELYVLEDNLRTPSGISYVLENRRIMKDSFPQLFEGMEIRDVDDYPSRLLERLEALAPPGVEAPKVAVLTPGPYNSAYFEHSFLAQQMGVELVEGRDLVVSDGVVQLRTTKGLQRVDVIYRRIDDDFLDPLCFRDDSMLGVPGLMDVYRQGRVTLANAPGTGVADDKAVYPFVPAIIDYYLGEAAILPNVPTYSCHDDSQRRYVLEHLSEMVVKVTNESGGYGMLIGPHATGAQHDEFRRRIEAAPRDYIGQPTLELSCVPTFIEGKLESRHVDLRPFVILGEEPYVLPGGLTRVALRKGSLVVNSSQGGGSKDTWVLAADARDASIPSSHANATS